MRASGSFVAAALALAACGGNATLVDAEVEREVARATSTLIAPVASVACPSPQEARAGATFACTVTFTGGGTAEVQVRQADAAGHLEIRAQGAWLRGDEIARDLTADFAAIGDPGEVTCGAAIIAVAGATTTECQVRRGGATSPATIRVDASGAVSLGLVR